MKISYVGSRRPIEAYRKLLKAIDTPHSLSIFIRIANDDWDFLLEDVNPLHYCDAHSYALDRQAHDFLKKSRDICSDVINENTTRAFGKAEEICSLTNKRLANPEPTGLSSIINIAIGKIARILGKIPNSFAFGHGPGTSTQVRGDDTAAYVKYATLSPHVTKRAARYVDESCLGTLWLDYLLENPGSLYTEKNSSRITQVPKNFKINRTIAIEPDLNIYFQKGIGSYLKSRLERHGIDLKDQTVNQYKARHAQSLGYATVDFSMASDTIAYNAVRDLLPFDWFFLLDEFRTPYYEDAEKVEKPFQKFSSMGNGYTFELESLIFFGLAYATVKEGSGLVDEISVYGDDVIIPASDYEKFKEVSTYYGFSINTEKTFISGCFFESCGKDYFNGSNVRPFYLKNSLSDNYDIFTCRNHLLEFCSRWKVNESPCDFLETLVGMDRFCVVPYPFSGGLWPRTKRDRDYLKRSVAPDGWEGVMVKALVFIPGKTKNSAYAPSILYSLVSGETGGFRTYRRRGRYKYKLTFFPCVQPG